MSWHERWMSTHGVVWECNGENKARRMQRVSALRPVPILTFHPYPETLLDSTKLRAQGGLQLPVCTTTALHVPWEL